MLHKARNTEPKIGSSIVPPSSGIQERGTRLPYLSSLPSRTSPLKFFASASTVKLEGPTNPQRAWKAEFLNDLRSNKPVRPNGSRPQPIRATAASPTAERDPHIRTSSAMSGSIRKTDPPLRTTSAMSGSLRDSQVGNSRFPDRCTSAMSHRRAQSGMPIPDNILNSKGRPLAQKPLPGATSRETLSVNRTSMIVPSSTYRERGHRWMEKQEARSIREALEDIDFKDEETLHAAAQDEASELVWKHQHPDLPYKNLYAPYDYNSHLQKGSLTRSQSDGPRVESIPMDETGGLGRQQPSDRVTLEGRSSSRASSGPSEHGRVCLDATKAGMKGHALWDSPQKKAYMNMKSPSPPIKTTGRRSSSEFRSRKVSGGLFRNPDDQIYEEPEEVATDTISNTNRIKSPPLQVKTRNHVSKLPPASPSPLRLGVISAGSDSKLSQFEIHKNPPSQSRNPSYLKNILPPTPPDSNSDSEAWAENPDQTHGIEIRSDDIKAATSMRLKDRSPKLPSPTVVSDRPGRPIVSFEQNWKPREINLEQEKSPPKPRTSLGEPEKKSTMQPSKPHLPATAVSPPPIPTINLPEPPSIHINDMAISSSMAETTASKPAVPSMTNASVGETFQKTRPLPNPTNSRPFKPLNRPLPTHSATAPASSSKPHWSPFPSFQRATAQCAACALPIAGRIVSASSQRFHPHCFTCHHCAAPLEHVAFYPEPSTSRDARLKRINARSNGADVPDEDGKKAEDDGDAGLRFFCHLDFHEHFSPRCRSCKTPIEGEVVVACGGEWHVGHFFCAQCGDPFDAKKPFVEREGYAWCVECHTRRFSGKCKGCRKPIVDLVVRALGAEWHENCFCCKECGGGFDDGRFFARGEEEIPVCVQCEERRLKA